MSRDLRAGVRVIWVRTNQRRLASAAPYASHLESLHSCLLPDAFILPISTFHLHFVILSLLQLYLGSFYYGSFCSLSLYIYSQDQCNIDKALTNHILDVVKYPLFLAWSLSICNGDSWHGPESRSCLLK